MHCLLNRASAVRRKPFMLIFPFRCVSISATRTCELVLASAGLTSRLPSETLDERGLMSPNWVRAWTTTFALFPELVNSYALRECRYICHHAPWVSVQCPNMFPLQLRRLLWLIPLNLHLRDVCHMYCIYTNLHYKCKYHTDSMHFALIQFNWLFVVFPFTEVTIWDKQKTGHQDEKVLCCLFLSLLRNVCHYGWYIAPPGFVNDPQKALYLVKMPG